MTSGLRQTQDTWVSITVETIGTHFMRNLENRRQSLVAKSMYCSHENQSLVRSTHIRGSQLSETLVLQVVTLLASIGACTYVCVQACT